MAAAGDEIGLAVVQAQVDEAAELWGITDRGLQEIRRSLAELGYLFLSPTFHGVNLALAPL